MGTKWIGGELAFRLNKDPELANQLMKANEKDIHVKVKKSAQRVEISGGLEDFPETTRESLDVFNRIAKHVREIAGDTSITSGVSRVERRVVRGSIYRRVIYGTLGTAAWGFCVGFVMIILGMLTGKLSPGSFADACILMLKIVPALALLVGLLTYLYLGIKRLFGRF